MAFIALVPSIYTNVKQYGALGDGKTVTDGAITSGLAVLASATAAFTAADVGKLVTVTGAGASGNPLNTTISAYTNATTVTLAATAGTTVTSATTLYGTNDTTAIAAALTAANAAGGGTVLFPAGLYLSGSQTLYPNVTLLGAGLGATTIKLKYGSNTDLFSAQTSSINLAAASNTSIIGTLFNFGIQGMTLDGNRNNQSSGPSYPLRFYGYNFILRDLQIMQGYSGGILIDWNGTAYISQPSDEMEALIDNVKIHDNNGTGLQMGGPHDTRLMNVLSWQNQYNLFHFAPNAVACQVVNPHGYSCIGGQGGVVCLCEAQSVVFVNPSFEGGDVGNLAALANEIQVIGGRLFFTAGSTIWGLKVGQLASETPLIGQILQSAGVTTAVAPSLGYYLTEIAECDGTHGSVWFDNDGGNCFDLTIYQTSGVQSTGTPSSASDYRFRGTATPYSFYTPGKLENAVFHAYPSGGTAIQSTPNSFIGLLIDPGAVGNKGLVIYAHASGATANLLELENYTFAAVFTVDPNGNAVAQSLSTAQSATAVAIAGSGAIPTAGIGVSRLAPTAARTGITMQAGTIPGQQCYVINESAFLLTYNATPATSKIANSAVVTTLAVNTGRLFVWDSITGLWY